MLKMRSLGASLLAVSSLAWICPALAIGLTIPNGASVDAAGEAYANPAGFVVAYTRIVTDPTPAVTVRARQYTPDGRRAAKELVFDNQPTALMEPVAIPIGSGSKVAGFWMRPLTGGVNARIGDTATGKLEAEKTFLTVAADRPAEANMDVVPLAGGKFALLTYRFDFSAGAEKRLAVTTIGPDLKVIAGPTMVPGYRTSYVATAASDFTAIDTKDGAGLVAYRNRTDGNVYVARMSATGVVSATPTRINTKAMPLGSGGQQTTFQVEASRLQGGRIVVAWTRIGSTNADDAFDVSYRVLSATGKPLSKELQAHTSAKQEQVAPEIVPLSDGGFSLSWTNEGTAAEGRPRSYFLRSYNADGTPRAAARRLFKGDRALNGPVAELVSNAHGRLVHIRGFGVTPTALQAIIADP